MKLGIATPVVTNVAGAPLTWEKDAAIEEIGRVAETADRLGYHHLTCSEHIGIPATEAGRRGTRYWDPLATLGYVVGAHRANPAGDDDVGARDTTTRWRS